MQAFTKLTARAAPLPMSNVDTDMIIPKQFLKTLTRTGLGQSLFYEMRYDEAGRKQADFVLNRPAFARAGVLITGENFGCGSSREHAVWALSDFGISCVIAPSFADIFYANCLKNGILPVVLPKKDINTLIARAGDENAPLTMTVDLAAQTIVFANQHLKFAIEDFAKTRLLQGLDDIRQTLAVSSKIAAFEARRSAEMDWI